MTRDQAELERAWLAECRGVAKGAAIAAGIIALGEWARRCHEAQDHDPEAEETCPECHAPPFRKCKLGCSYA